MANTDNLQLPILAAAQAQKHVTVNESLLALDAVVQLSVKSRTLTSPPGGIAAGDRYLVAATASGAWLGKEGLIAAYQNSAHEFYTPQAGWQCYVEDEAVILVYDGTLWLERDQSMAPHGGASQLVAVEELLTGLSGPSVSTTIAFPNQCIVLGASVRVTTAITGATSFSVGDGVTPNRFGGSLGVSLGSTNQGTVGPAGNYSSTPVTLTAAGGNFTGGAVRVTLHYLLLQPAVS